MFYLVMVSGNDGFKMVVSGFMNGICVRILVKRFGVMLVIVFISRLFVLFFNVISCCWEVSFVFIRCFVIVMKLVNVFFLFSSLLFLYYSLFILLLL